MKVGLTHLHCGESWLDRLPLDPPPGGGEPGTLARPGKAKGFNPGNRSLGAL
jgi:hypothetical protein